MKMIKVIAIMTVCGVLAGCGKYATKDDLNAINANVEKATLVANKALTATNKLSEEIAQVKDVTSVCCAENRARLDALFEKAMRK